MQGTHVPFIDLDHVEVCSIWPVWRQTYGYLPGRRASPSTDCTNYTAWWQGQVGVNNLPGVITQLHPNQESNPQPLDCKSNAQLVTSRPNHSKYNNHALCDCGLTCTVQKPAVDAQSRTGRWERPQSMRTPAEKAPIGRTAPVAPSAWRLARVAMCSPRMAASGG